MVSCAIWIYLTHISHVKSVSWKISTCKRLTFRLTPPPAPKQRRNVPGGRAPYPEICSNDLIVWWFSQINLWYLMLLSRSKQCRSKSWVSALFQLCIHITSYIYVNHALIAQSYIYNEISAQTEPVQHKWPNNQNLFAIVKIKGPWLPRGHLHSVAPTSLAPYVGHTILCPLTDTDSLAVFEVMTRSWCCLETFFCASNASSLWHHTIRPKRC